LLALHWLQPGRRGGRFRGLPSWPHCAAIVCALRLCELWAYWSPPFASHTDPTKTPAFAPGGAELWRALWRGDSQPLWIDNAAINTAVPAVLKRYSDEPRNSGAAVAITREWVAAAAPARHADCDGCSEGRTGPHRSCTHRRAGYRPSTAGRRDPRTPSRYHRRDRRSQWPVHPSEQPADANCNYGSRVGLRLDGAT
jgi:hypothetical protein